MSSLRGRVTPILAAFEQICQRRTRSAVTRPPRPPSHAAPRTANQSGARGKSRSISAGPSEPANAICTPAERHISTTSLI